MFLKDQPEIEEVKFSVISIFSDYACLVLDEKQAEYDKHIDHISYDSWGDAFEEIILLSWVNK